MSVNPVDSIIDAAGGEDSLAAACQISTDAIRKWRKNRCVPPKNWPLLIDASSGSITYAQLETLWRASAIAAE